MVAMRGLDSTCTEPCDSRKEIMAAKLLVWNARPNSEPALLAALASAEPVIAEMPAVPPLGFTAGWPQPAGSGARPVPGARKPPDRRLLPPPPNEAKLAQLMPLWKPLFSW